MTAPDWKPTMPQSRSNFWDQLARFESGLESQSNGLIVRTPRPQIPPREDHTFPAPKSLGAPISDAAKPPDPAVRRIPPGAEATPVGQKEIAPHEAAKQNPPLQDRNSELAAESGRVDLVFDPSQTSKDMVVRLELGIEEEWDDDLENFCRLRRLGLIKEAKKHFKSTLEHVTHIPYVRVQYAEMLESSGDYKGFQSLSFLPEFNPSPWEETADDRSRARLAANYALLDLLSQRPLRHYLVGAWAVVRNTLKALAVDTFRGSTEVSRGNTWTWAQRRTLI